MSFCPSCGRGVQAASQFCAHCGAPLQGAAPPPAYAQAPGAYAAPAYAPHYAPAPGHAAQPYPATLAARVRPVGVAVIAVLGFIFAALYGLGGLVLTLGGGAFAGTASSGDGFGAALGGALGTILLVIGLFVLAIAALMFFVSYGLWTGKGWARMLQLVLAWIGLVFGVFGLFAAFEEPGLLVVQLPLVALYGLIIWYFMQPNVKEFFASSAPIA